MRVQGPPLGYYPCQYLNAVDGLHTDAKIQPVLHNCFIAYLAVGFVLDSPPPHPQIMQTFVLSGYCWRASPATS